MISGIILVITLNHYVSVRELTNDEAASRFAAVFKHHSAHTALLSDSYAGTHEKIVIGLLAKTGHFRAADR